MSENNSKSNSKYSIIALFIAIMLPVVVVFLVRHKSDNTPKVKFPRKMLPIGVDSFRNAGGDIVYDTQFHRIPDFNFVDQYGKSFESKEVLHDKVWLAEFFYTSCPGICPIMNTSMQAIQKEFSDDNDFKIVSFSIDPNTDSIPILKEYADRMGALYGKWYFLHGKETDIHRLGVDGFKLASGGNEDEEQHIVHSDKFVLVDWDNNIRGYYSGTDSTDVRKLKGDIVLLLKYKTKRM